MQVKIVIGEALTYTTLLFRVHRHIDPTKCKTFLYITAVNVISLYVIVWTHPNATLNRWMLSINLHLQVIYFYVNAYFYAMSCPSDIPSVYANELPRKLLHSFTYSNAAYICDGHPYLYSLNALYSICWCLWSYPTLTNLTPLRALFKQNANHPQLPVQLHLRL